MAFAACTKTVAKGAETFTYIADNLGFHFRGLLVLPESIIVRKHQTAETFKDDRNRLLAYYKTI